MEEMAQQLKMKPFQMEKRSREQFGRTVQELLEEIRVRMACSYLAATERSVTQIGQDVGFGSISTFQRSFQKYMNHAERIQVGISIVCKKMIIIVKNMNIYFFSTDL